MNIKILLGVLALGTGSTVLTLAGAPAAFAQEYAPRINFTPTVGDIRIRPSAEELDAMLAPIALYPDQLLSQILMASTYPLDVVAAARWAAEPFNQGLNGDRLARALEDQDWDPSVKALVAFPEVLKMLDSDLTWMARLGDAFVVAEADVMDSVQRLRRDAQAANQLASDTRRNVTIVEQQIIIEPANPEVIYVPFYDPRVVYGTWRYPAYPPVYLRPPIGYTYYPGVYYSFVSVSPFWGWSRWDWRARRIHIVDLPRYTYHNRGRGPIGRDVWRHDPRHRQGVNNRAGDRDWGRNQDRNRRSDIVDGRRDRNGPGPNRITGPNSGVIETAAPINPNRNNRGDNFRTRRQTPPGGLPDVTPQLPQIAPVPAAAPPVPQVRDHNWNRDSRDNFRTRRQPQADQPAQAEQPRRFGGRERGPGGEPRVDNGMQRQQRAFRQPPHPAPLQPQQLLPQPANAAPPPQAAPSQQPNFRQRGGGGQHGEGPRRGRTQEARERNPQ